MRRFLPTKKRQRTPVADCDQYFLRKKGTKHPRHRHGFLATFDTKKYKVPRGRRPRLTADQKAANNISRRLRSVLFAEKRYKEVLRAKTAVVLVPLQAIMRRFKTASRGDRRLLCFLLVPDASFPPLWRRMNPAWRKRRQERGGLKARAEGTVCLQTRE